jgi:isocitrate dehydrogenase (NAD+)
MLRCLLRSRPKAVSIRSFSSTKKEYKVILFPGDGVGPELTESATAVLAATGVKINWITNLNIGYGNFQKTGKFIGEEHLKAFDEHRVIFKGPITIPPGETNTYTEVRGRKFTSANQVLRKVYNLYANIRPATSLPEGLKHVTPFSNVDIVIFRENTEDVYTGEEKWVNNDTVELTKRITRGASTRIAKVAFEYARNNKRKRLTAVHKANVCKQTDGLFLACAKEVAKSYPDVKYDEFLADSLLTRMVQKPQEFDILLCPNLFGDLVSDLAAGLIGSLGLMPSALIGDNGYAVFEPAHGSAPDIAGKGIVNPISQIRCASMMLRHLGEISAAEKVEKAVNSVLSEGSVVPIDLGGKATTKQLTQALVEKIKKQ